MTLWKTETTGGVAVASYDNPPMNYLCAEGTRELEERIESWKSPDVRAVILTGAVAGKFITHYSVEELFALASNRELLVTLGARLTAGFHAILERLRALPKPVLVAMNGDAMGGGFELSLACDIRIAEIGDYRFGLPEVKLGILPGGGGTQRLARLVGTGRAMEFILRGRVVPPEEALALGLVHEVGADAVARAREIAAELAELPPKALGQAKRAIYAGADTHLTAGLEIESSAFLETMLSDDAREAMKAYIAAPLERRRGWIEKPPRPGRNGR